MSGDIAMQRIDEKLERHRLQCRKTARFGMLPGVPVNVARVISDGQIAYIHCTESAGCLRRQRQHHADATI